MLNNPELRRNIWLDFTRHRMLLTPIILGLILYPEYLLLGAKASANTAFWIGCFFIFFWGTKRASETVLEEVNNNTWDFQRQSAISPWSMTLGKLFGATLFSWYGAAIALTWYTLFGGSENNTLLLLADNKVPLSYEIVALVLNGLIGQSLALLLSMQVLPLIRHEKSNPTFRYFVLGLFIAIGLSTESSHMLKSGMLKYSTISWYNLNFDKISFVFTIRILFLAWALIGLMRSFAKELQYQALPWVWAAFNIFCLVYLSGFVSFDNIALEAKEIPSLGQIAQFIDHAPYYAAFGVGIALTYIAVFVEPLSSVRYKKLLQRFDEGHTQECASLIPWWSVSFVIALLAGILAATQSFGDSSILEEYNPRILILTSLLFLARDILIVHYFTFSKSGRKAVATSIIYLIVLYFLVATLLRALSLSAWLPAILPSTGQNTPLALISVVAQIAFVAVLVRKKWVETWRSV